MSDLAGAQGDPGWHERELERINEPTKKLVVIPTTGELLDPANLPHVATTLDELAELERQIKGFKRALIDLLDAESQRQGKRTLNLDGIEVELTGRTKIEWDIEALREQLADAGLPEERLDELIVATVSYKVDGTVVRQLRAANQAYAEVLDACRTEVPATVYVRGIRR